MGGITFGQLAPCWLHLSGHRLWEQAPDAAAGPRPPTSCQFHTQPPLGRLCQQPADQRKARLACSGLSGATATPSSHRFWTGGYSRSGLASSAPRWQHRRKGTQLGLKFMYQKHTPSSKQVALQSACKEEMALAPLLSLQSQAG